MLHFFSASTGTINSERAITECLENAFANTSGTDCDLIIIHSSIGHNFPKMLQKAQQMAPSARIVGCTCAGVIGREGANENLRALAIMAVRADNASELSIASCDGIRGHNSFELAQKMAKELKDQNPEINSIQILASGIDFKILTSTLFTSYCGGPCY